MKFARKLCLVMTLGLLIPTADAAMVYGSVGRITQVMTYVSFGNGDVAIWTQTQLSGCDGFWFRTTEVNGKEIYAQLMLAQQNQQPLSFWAYDDQLWTGTSSRFCKLYSVGNIN